MSLSLKRAVTLPAQGHNKHSSPLGHSLRGAVGRDVKGTLRLWEGKGRCFFLFTPGSGLRSFSPQHEQSSSSNSWFQLQFFLIIPEADSMVPTQRCQH